MRRIFHSDTFRAPQFIAGALLLAYLLQVAWLVRVGTLRQWMPDPEHALHVSFGYQQWMGGPVAGTPESWHAEPGSTPPSGVRMRDEYDQDRSPLYYLVAAAPLLVRPGWWLPAVLIPLLAMTPYLFFGAMLGASLWYVARRLYGNAGGYIALMLYCFSPAMINVWGAYSLDELGGVWGTFGSVFTAIAVAHTLYAPREVVLWNWRRILLLGLSLTLAMGHQFSLGIMALVILPLMLWVAPVRPRAVLAIWCTAIVVSLGMLSAAYCFHARLLWEGLRHGRWIDFHSAAFVTESAWRNVFRGIALGSPPLMIALPATLIAYVAWRRARYFGNTAPLLIALLLLVLAVGAPGFPGQGFPLAMLVFLFVFVAGVCADLLETRHRPLVLAGLCGLLAASAIWNLRQLMLLR